MTGEYVPNICAECDTILLDTTPVVCDECIAQAQAENKRLRTALQFVLGRVMSVMIIEPQDSEERRVNRSCRGIIEDINTALGGGE